MRAQDIPRAWELVRRLSALHDALRHVERDDPAGMMHVVIGSSPNFQVPIPTAYVGILLRDTVALVDRELAALGVLVEKGPA